VLTPKRAPRRSKLPSNVIEFLREIGRRGGKAAGGSPAGRARAKALGEARAKTMTVEQRRQAAIKAVTTRWANDTSTKAERRKAARKAARARWKKKT